MGGRRRRDGPRRPLQPPPPAPVHRQRGRRDVRAAAGRGEARAGRGRPVPGGPGRPLRGGGVHRRVQGASGLRESGVARGPHNCYPMLRIPAIARKFARN
jgi:hypothetical protein